MLLKNADNAPELHNLFSSIGIPVPFAGAYYETGDDREIIFLTRYSILISIYNQERVLPEYFLSHPNTLQSLLTKKIDSTDYLVSIFPGVDCSLDREQATQKFQEIELNGLNYMDRTKPSNVGIIPGTSHHVIVDLDTDEMRQAYNHRNDFEWQLLLDVQRDTYRELTELGRHFWSEDDKYPISYLFHDFLNACLNFKSQNKLVSTWVTHPYYESAESALNYDNQLQLSGF